MGARGGGRVVGGPRLRQGWTGCPWRALRQAQWTSGAAAIGSGARVVGVLFEARRGTCRWTVGVHAVGVYVMVNTLVFI